MKAMESGLKKEKIVIYKNKKNQAAVKVYFDKETVWLNQAQITALFGVDRSVVTKHIRNIFRDGEVKEKSNVQKMHIANSDKPVQFYSLDIVLAVGYRTNTTRGIEFRTWATRVLKDHIIKGVTLNQKRLEALRGARLEELGKTVKLLDRSRRKALNPDEAVGLLDVISNYAKTWLILEQYDKDGLLEPRGPLRSSEQFTYAKAKEAVEALRNELVKNKQAGDLFASERGRSFEGIISGLEQAFGGQALYPGISEKAAHLFYFIIKDHPFSDGNKRIASLLFILFLNQNKFLLRESGERKINDNTLVALALLVAESNPKDKDVMIKIILNLLV